MLLAGALCAAAAFAQTLPMAKSPEEVGFSSKRLEKTRQAYRDDVEKKTIPGAVLVIVRNGKIATYDAIGYQERAAQTPMKKDSIFRVASMSKPITTVAAMILVEENKLDLGAPVAQYLPEFRGVKVGAEGAAPKRPMTVQDLMRHTSGLTYGLFGNSAIDQMYRKADIFNSKSLAEMVKTDSRHASAAPAGGDLGIQRLDRCSGTGGGSGQRQGPRCVYRGARHRAAEDEGYRILGEAGRPSRGWLCPIKNPACRLRIQPSSRVCFRAAAACSPRASDYARFSQMLLNGGELEGVRILGPKTIALMTSDQLPANVERHTPVAMALGPFGPTPEMGTQLRPGFRGSRGCGAQS